MVGPRHASPFRSSFARRVLRAATPPIFALAARFRKVLLYSCLAVQLYLWDGV